MTSLRTRLSNAAVVAAYLGIGATSVFGMLAIGIIVTLCMFAIITAFQALILWVVWNWTAPMFDFIPAQYKEVEFMAVWGVTAVCRIIGRIFFATNKDKK